ncbi:magnesium transporter CorA family protein [Lactiplantibacillus pentosus]|uniref:magnesium transporter CorA family protein n=1 Tax=Lactiplantibacillus pentosus TaxID=1589 RepID=UPI001C1EFF3D|nr:magnesium transporter CorA family protein [Lactiplantibacillus pentosus]MBU7465232.1 magnesium transporter CorA family protein [Lactiplantibacillus pentosus]MBU7491200.1 magnesium transporter CorA family protein [Lactiplantibacillus pentosus]MBU7493741.1 magnesium transporter CorA family protein [Lactiplantibacillus pentosus]MBU7519796.1 magnesium transporter CorA family protein [Lactiplantibacillus pentosus]MBU7526915.1 magnesium transporter CorA family protein [Lactiplantibacillus pentosu
MIDHYLIQSDGITTTSRDNANWIVLQGASDDETQQVIDTYELPANIFDNANEGVEVSELKKLKHTRFATSYSLVLTNLSAATDDSIEKRLEPLSFIVTDQFLITYVCQDSTFIERLLEQHATEITSNELLVSYAILEIYEHYVMELTALKTTIDELDQAARETTRNDELFRLANTQRTMVFLDQTLQDQAKTLEAMFKNDDYLQKLNNEALQYDIELQQRYADKLVRTYRDLLETIGGLFSDMMDNRLNHLMKYLDSAGLIISIPALITGIWGMNTGGLPGEDSPMTFMIVIGLSAVLAIVAGVHLKNKDFSE